MGTSNLNLSVTPEVSGSETLFLTWRTQMDGDSASSNMGKIDAWAGLVSGSLTALAVSNIYSGSAVGDGENYTSIISGVTTLTVGQTINLRLDTTNTGSVSLNLNGLGAKSIYKINSSGNQINVVAGDLKKNARHLFRYDGNWIWVSSNAGDQINVVGNSGNIITISASGIADGGISASSLALVTGSYVVLSLNDNLKNEWLLTAGSSVSLIQDTSSSRIYLHVNTPGAKNDLVFLSGTGSLVDSGIMVGNAVLSGSYVVNPFLVKDKLPMSSGTGSLVDSGLMVSNSKLSGSYINPTSLSGSYIINPFLVKDSIPMASGTGSLVDAGIGVMGSKISGSFIKSGSSLAIVSGSLVLAETGVTTGSYNRVNVDVYGRVTTGTVFYPASSINVVIGDGANVVTSGSKARIKIPYEFYITGVTMLADATGYVGVDITKATYDNFPTMTSIVASACPTLVNAQKSTNTTLAGWTRNINKGDVLVFYIDADATTIKQFTLELSGSRLSV